VEELLKSITRREFINICSKENLRHAFGAWNSFQEGVKEKSRYSCDEAGKMFFKNRLRQHGKLK